MPPILTNGLSVKVATTLDVISTLFAGELGYVFAIPAYHPIILGYAVGVSFVLFKWKDEITLELLKLAEPLQRRGKYNYARNRRFRHAENLVFVHSDKVMKKNLRLKMNLLKNALQGKAKEKQKGVYLFVEGMRFNQCHNAERAKNGNAGIVAFYSGKVRPDFGNSIRIASHDLYRAETIRSL